MSAASTASAAPARCSTTAQPVRSCLMFAAQADGRSITTVEGLAPDQDHLHPLQEAMHDRHGLQCGYCTPGILMTMMAFLDETPSPDEAQIREALSGNLCRCTGYQHIVEAVSCGRAAAGSSHEHAQFRRADPAQRGRAAAAGQALFVDDVELPGMLHAAFLRSNVAHARIRSHRRVGGARPRRGRRGLYRGRSRRLLAPGPLLVPPPPIEGHRSSTSARRCRSPRTRSAMSVSRSRSCWRIAATSPRTRSAISRSISSRCRRWSISKRR